VRSQEKRADEAAEKDEDAAAAKSGRGSDMGATGSSGKKEKRRNLLAYNKRKGE
jgi:hypothetical protein